MQGNALESFYYWITLNFEITAVLLFQLEVYYKGERLLFLFEKTKDYLVLLLIKLEQPLDGIQIKHLYKVSTGLPTASDDLLF